MEPSKANTVGIVKKSPSLRTTRRTLQFFRACSGFRLFFPKYRTDNKPSITTWVTQLSKDQTKGSKPTRKKMMLYLRFKILKNHTSLGGTYLPKPYMGFSTSRRLHVSSGWQTWILTTNARFFRNFLLLNIAFCYLNIFEF